jgi:hypothetical protein
MMMIMIGIVEIIVENKRSKKDNNYIHNDSDDTVLKEHYIKSIEI